MPRYAKVDYRTRTRTTRFGNTAGIPVPVLNPSPRAHSRHSLRMLRLMEAFWGEAERPIPNLLGSHGLHEPKSCQGTRWSGVDAWQSKHVQYYLDNKLWVIDWRWSGFYPPWFEFFATPSAAITDKAPSTWEGSTTVTDGLRLLATPANHLVFRPSMPPRLLMLLALNCLVFGCRNPAKHTFDVKIDNMEAFHLNRCTQVPLLQPVQHSLGQLIFTWPHIDNLANQESEGVIDAKTWSRLQTILKGWSVQWRIKSLAMLVMGCFETLGSSKKQDCTFLLVVSANHASKINISSQHAIFNVHRFLPFEVNYYFLLANSWMIMPMTGVHCAALVLKLCYVSNGSMLFT